VRISDVMTTDLEFVDGGATVQQAAELMGELDVGALPAGSSAHVEGVLTDRDILFRVVAAGLDGKSTLVRDVLSQPVIACRDTDEISVAMDVMASNHVRRLLVQDEGGQVVGWITMADVSRKLLVEGRLMQSALQDLTKDTPTAN
jgi:CBS domain-containing protein